MVSSKDALWTIAATLISAFCQLAQLAVAARYLDTQAFGALAIVNVMMAIVSGFQDLGLSSYCIHLGEVPRRSQSTLYWISAALGGLCMLAVMASALPLAQFYKMPALTTLLPLLSLTFLIVGFSGQYQANFVRVFKARLLAQIELGARPISFTVTLLLLYRTEAGAAAPVIGLEIFWLLRLMLMAALAPAHWHPRLEFDRVLARRAVAYGGYQSGGNIIGQLRYQADQLILGKALGPEALGLYSIAKELVGYPLRVMQPLVARLTLPLLAHHQHDPEALRKAFVAGLRRIALFSTLIFIPFALLAPWIVEMLYGPAYAPVATLAAVMALYGALRPMGLNASMLAQATGHAAIEFRWNAWMVLLVLLPNLLIAFVAPSLSTFAVTLSALQLLMTVLLYPMLIKPLQAIGMSAYLSTWALPAGAALAASAVGSLIHPPSLRSLLHAWGLM